MEHLYFDNTGLLHLISSLLAVFFGTLALLLEKGTTLHKQIGYAYTLCMLIVITTAFMIYRLFGGFGMFHIAAVVSTITLIAGLYPAFFMRKNPKWVYLHFAFMYWSVMGLYAALISETMVRIPNTPFYSMIGVSVGAVMFVAAYIFTRKSEKWQKTLSSQK